MLGRERSLGWGTGVYVLGGAAQYWHCELLLQQNRSAAITMIAQSRGPRELVSWSALGCWVSIARTCEPFEGRVRLWVAYVARRSSSHAVHFVDGAFFLLLILPRSRILPMKYFLQTCPWPPSSPGAPGAPPAAADPPARRRRRRRRRRCCRRRRWPISSLPRKRCWPWSGRRAGLSAPLWRHASARRRRATRRLRIACACASRRWSARRRRCAPSAATTASARARGRTIGRDEQLRSRSRCRWLTCDHQ